MEACDYEISAFLRVSQTADNEECVFVSSDVLLFSPHISECACVSVGRR